MRELFQSKKIFMVGGAGGVGKTTLAAALGIELAQSGYKTLVLTVDPARRLAQALGFENFQEELQAVPLPDGKGSLHASMLDTQRYLDKILDRFATSPEQKAKVRANPLYRTMVDSLGGTTEYAAMERLLEFANDPRFEKIVVDTPPTQNAVDLLSAPQRMADFMDNSVLKWFQGKKPLYMQFFKQGTKLAMKALQKIFGSDFLERLGELMNDIDGMQTGFRNRNLEVMRLLQSSDTAFLLVTYPTEARYLETVSFLKTLEGYQIRLAGLILNRVEPAVAAHEGSDDELNALLAYYHSLYVHQQVWVERFAASLTSIPRWMVPRQTGALHDVASLSHLARFLVF